MAGVYSIRLFAVSLTGPTSPTVYTVPAATTVVLREVDAYVPDVSPTPLFFVLSTVPATAFFLTASAGPASVQWRGRLVMPAGESLELSLGGGNWRVYGSGYLLSA